MQHTNEQRSLQILHGALCMGCVLFLAVLLYLNSTNGPAVKDDLRVLEYVGLASLMLVPLSFVLFHKRLAHLRTAAAPFSTLRAALIVHWALIEGTCFFNAVVFLVTGSWVAFGAAVLALVILASRAPTQSRVVAWLTGPR